MRSIYDVKVKDYGDEDVSFDFVMESGDHVVFDYKGETHVARFTIEAENPMSCLNGQIDDGLLENYSVESVTTIED